MVITRIPEDNSYRSYLFRQAPSDFIWPIPKKSYRTSSKREEVSKHEGLPF